MMKCGRLARHSRRSTRSHGDGPRTFADLVTQEFQWSRSLVMLLLQYSPRLVGRLPLRLKFQFLFSQLGIRSSRALWR